MLAKFTLRGSGRESARWLCRGFGLLRRRVWLGVARPALLTARLHTGPQTGDVGVLNLRLSISFSYLEYIWDVWFPSRL